MCGIIERHSVPLLSNWKTFITSSENKQNPAAFLSRDIIFQAKKLTLKYECIVTGNIAYGTDVESSGLGNL